MENLIDKIMTVSYWIICAAAIACIVNLAL
nr:MAG TPA: hypothetical protein [Caudoviricetes sp.]